MRLSNVSRERGLWPRSLVLVILLGVGTACGGGGDSAGGGASAPDRGAAGTATTEAQPAAADGQQQVSPSPLSPGQSPAEIVERALTNTEQVIPAPPAPDLGIGQPQVPPNTVSLEDLHRDGLTHVVR